MEKKNTEGNVEEIQEATASLAATANEVSVDAAPEEGLLEFHIKRRTPLNFFSTLLLTDFGVTFFLKCHGGGDAQLTGTTL